MQRGNEQGWGLALAGTGATGEYTAGAAPALGITPPHGSSVLLVATAPQVVLQAEFTAWMPFSSFPSARLLTKPLSLKQHSSFKTENQLSWK